MNFGKSKITKIIEIVLVILVMLCLTVLYSKILGINEIKTQEKVNEEKRNLIFKNIQTEYAYLDKYTIYGNHLNLGGYVKNEFINTNISNIYIVLKDLDGNDIEYSLEYSLGEEKINFELSKNINEGIDLEKISEGNYYIFLKVITEKEENYNSYYYTIKNITDYGENEYYTMTKNNVNLKINIVFNNLKINEKQIEYMQIVALKSQLPNDVYDIVIDPGHGGRDPGAVYDDNYESEYTLKYSLELKKRLEALGYKVMLTREEDEYIESYDLGGRAVLPNQVKAKLFLSIHLNSTIEKNPQGGVEVYASNNENLDFAKSIADNIVNTVGTTYSPNNNYKVLDGVYVRTYNDEEVKEAIEYAKDLGYEPYDTLSTNTPYLFIIRETGGIMTKAYVDGRNKNIGSNPYYLSNMTTEAYLLELGFINSKRDIKLLKENRQEYIDAIVNAVISHYM